MGFKFNVKRLCTAEQELRGILSVCECVCVRARVCPARVIMVN